MAGLNKSGQPFEGNNDLNCDLKTQCNTIQNCKPLRAEPRVMPFFGLLEPKHLINNLAVEMITSLFTKLNANTFAFM